MNASDPKATPAAPGWWRFRIMWLVVGGPLVVVVASFVTLALAILNPDPVLTPVAGANPAERPAVEMRNHAAQPPAR